jgi:hypothetical protein
VLTVKSRSPSGQDIDSVIDSMWRYGK